MLRARCAAIVLCLAVAPAVSVRADPPAIAQEAPVVLPVPAETHDVDAPRLALRSDGGFVAVWNDLQRRRAVGRWLGPPAATGATGAGESGTFSLSAEQASSSLELARGDGDTYLAAWNAYPGGHLVARAFDGRGAPLAAEQIALDHAGPSFALARSPGGFVVAYLGYEAPGGLQLRFLDAEGAPVGPAHPVAGVPAGFGLTGLAVAADSEGEVAVSWSLLSLFPPATISSSARGFDASGVPLGPAFELRPATAGAGSQDVVLSAVGPGRFLAAWSEPRPTVSLPSQVLIRRFDAAGSDLGSPVAINTDASPDGFVGQVSLAVGSDGLGVVAWSEGVSGSGETLHGRLVGADGRPRSEPFIVAPEVLRDASGNAPYATGLTADRDAAGHLLFGWGVGLRRGGSSSPVAAAWTSRARRFLESPSEPTGPAEAPSPPEAPPLTSPSLAGYLVWARITDGGGVAVLGSAYEPCIAETLCVVGRVPGRSELFVRVVGPKPNGRLWPTLVKLSTSEVEVWIEQAASGLTRYYDLPGATPGVDELPGLFDRQGFPP